MGKTCFFAMGIQLNDDALLKQALLYRSRIFFSIFGVAKHK